ncbi:DoxX-like family protein [Pedobacter sp. N36a]|uniref:DoxX-like family protein n=1 Tax=Pedobacter sp. N36a TaxID=2767996 RepID=UPI0016575FA7|nr:DoxX-like family protein [Pedobacter sp. N36a]MBC8988492.1 DoxX-like family protein [Pedobacter sp. N36a]
MKYKNIHRILSISIALVWIVNGLFCKVLNLVPRHEQIIARILGDTYSRPLAIIIGLSEIGMAIWILSRIKPRLNAMIQIITVAAMNILEFIFVPDFLFWGKMNSIFAFMFILTIYLNEFYMNKRTVNPS